MTLTKRFLAVALFVAALGIRAEETYPEIPGINAAMKESISKNEVAGAVTLVATGDKILHFSAAGKADLAADKPMRTDSICWIASMTKPVTAVAILMMQDEGLLSVDDPVSKYIPELAGLKTKDGKPGNITIKQLLTHTSGMGEPSPDEYRAARKLADFMPVFASKPLGFEPGTQWRYCQSSINTAGRIVEIVSKQSFPEFVQKRIVEPLGMKDTTFFLSEAQAARLAKSYKVSDGKFEEAANFILFGSTPTSTERCALPNGGLFSTALDYTRFCQMLVNGGTLNGKQILKPESVKYLSSPLTGDLRAGFVDGSAWGLAVSIVREPKGVTAMVSPGTYGHGGAYGTQAWIDPITKRIYILMVQRSNFPNADNSDLRKAFQLAAVDALK